VGGVGTLVRAALPSLPVVNRLPGIRKTGDPMAGLAHQRKADVRREHVDRYAAVCGFPRKDTVPLTYPHLLAFPLHMAIMSDPVFPWPAVGMVHLENVITAHRPVRVGESLDLRVEVDEPRPHARGALVDLRAEASAGEEVVWESTSTYLRRGVSMDGEAGTGLALPVAPPSSLEWRLAGDLGRRYAAVSGDHNPIHLHPLTARALGFPRQIAHGMWTLARCVAALENRLPASVTVEAGFRKPVLLPGTVAFGHAVDGHTHAFALTRPTDGAAHLVGRARPA
jgi:acyl dehydratase